VIFSEDTVCRKRSTCQLVLVAIKSRTVTMTSASGVAKNSVFGCKMPVNRKFTFSAMSQIGLLLCSLDDLCNSGLAGAGGPT